MSDGAQSTMMFPIRANEKLLHLPGRTRDLSISPSNDRRNFHMSVETIPPAEYSRVRADTERDATLAFPVLDKEPDASGAAWRPCPAPAIPPGHTCAGC